MLCSAVLLPSLMVLFSLSETDFTDDHILALVYDEVYMILDDFLKLLIQL